jgi:hypothetical protein
MDQQNQDEQFVDVTHTGSDQLKQETALDAFLAKRSIAASGARWGKIFFGIQVLAVFIVSCMATLQVNVAETMFAGFMFYVTSQFIGQMFFLGLSGFSSIGMAVSKSGRVKGAKAMVIGALVLLFTMALTATLLFVLWARLFESVVEK